MSTMGLLDALKKIEKIIKENAFKQIKKKKCRLKFNLGLALISLSTTEPWRKSIASQNTKLVDGIVHDQLLSAVICGNTYPINSCLFNWFCFFYHHFWRFHFELRVK